MTKDLKNIIGLIKKPVLHFSLVSGMEDTTPMVESYYGGKPYITNENEIKNCEHCKVPMQFICQFLIPDKRVVTNELYALFFCFDCLNHHDVMQFSLNIYTNPKEEKMVQNSEYESIIPYNEIKFAPAYELPEWQILKAKFPEVSRNLDIVYGSEAMEVYQQTELQVRDYLDPTGFKYKGYTEVLPYDQIPICPITGVPMEPFLHMESIPEIDMIWGDENGHFILFKSPTELYFEVKIFTVKKPDDDFIGNY